jgi:hypothetical protein
MAAALTDPRMRICSSVAPTQQSVSKGVPPAPSTDTSSSWSSVRGESQEAVARRLGSYASKLQDFPNLVKWLTRERRISAATLHYYKVGATQTSFNNTKKECVTFPWYTDGVEGVVRAKLRAYDDKKCMRLDPAGAIWGFFGWNTIEANDEEIVVTEGEIDALSVFQETGMKAVSLPNGANSLPPELVKLLERFKTIYLWLDDDIPGKVSQ